MTMSVPGREKKRRITHARLGWVEVCRLFVVVFSVALLLIWQVGRPYFTAAYTLLLLVAAVDLAYMALRRTGTVGLETLARVEVLVDVVCVTLLIYLTGGVQNFFSLLYFFVVLGAAILLGWRWAMATASAATISMAVVHISLVLGYYWHLDLPGVQSITLRETHIRWNFVVANLVAHGVAFHLVAALAALLDRELRRVRIVYEEIVEEMSEGLIAIDVDTRIVVVNSAARRLLHYDPEERLTGRPLLEVFRRKQDKRILEILLAFESTRAQIEVETREGETESIEIAATVLRDASTDEVRGVVGVLRDLTVQKRLEAAERRAARLEEVEHIALGLAHEIRNPLASIRGGVQELVRADGDPPDPDDASRLGRIISRESDRLDDIVQQFLSVAKMRPETYHSVALGPLMEEVAVLLRHRSDADEIEVELDLENDARVYGDPDQLRQVFLNLGINAIEAMEGRGTLGVRLDEAAFSQRIVSDSEERRSTLSEQDGVELEIRDEGPGIPEEDLPRIFTPFFTTKAKGTGLGLPTVHKIVQNHGGHVVVKTGEWGTSFRIWFPTDLASQLRSEHEERQGEDA